MGRPAPEKTFVFASWSEHGAGRNFRKLPSPVGVRCANGVPEGTFISGGYAGALVNDFEFANDLRVGAVITASRIVNMKGRTIWEGEPLQGISVTAIEVVVMDSDRVIDDPRERQSFFECTGAQAVDMESGVLAREKKLGGYLRVISDNQTSLLRRMAGVLQPDGRIGKWAFVKAFREPFRTSMVIKRTLVAQRVLQNLALT